MSILLRNISKQLISLQRNAPGSIFMNLNIIHKLYQKTKNLKIRKDGNYHQRDKINDQKSHET